MAQAPLKNDHDYFSSLVPNASLLQRPGLLSCPRHGHKAALSWLCPHPRIPPGLLLPCLPTQHCQDSRTPLLGDCAKGQCAVVALWPRQTVLTAPSAPALSCSTGALAGTAWPWAPQASLEQGRLQMAEVLMGSIHGPGSGRRCWRGEATSTSGPWLCLPAQLHWLHCFHEDLPQQSSRPVLPGASLLENPLFCFCATKFPWGWS